MLVENHRQKAGKDPEEWLENCPEFSRGMAGKIRALVLQWMPDMKQSVKWGALCFSGRKLILAVGAFKKHVGVSFFRGTELDDRSGLFDGGEANTNLRTIRLTSLEDFNMDALRELVMAAVELDESPSISPAPKVKRKPMPIPESLSKALKKVPAAKSNFEAMNASCQREWIAWINNAKRPETLEKRLEIVVKAAAQGLRWEQRKQAEAT